MLRVGDTVRTDSGRTLRIEQCLEPGGQAQPFQTRDESRGEAGVLKVFRDRSPALTTRVRFLRAAGLREACSALIGPSDVLLSDKVTAHYSPLAPGEKADAVLEGAPGSLTEHLALALALAHAVACLHARGIAHGDLHAGNVFVHREGGKASIHLIDFDNFAEPSQPPPPCAGHSLYMAPELRLALKSGKELHPSERTDRFALAVLLHELILLRHVAAGCESSAAEFERAMASGGWVHDPSTPAGAHAAAGGYPSRILDVDLARLFRRALGLEPDERPAAIEWAEALRKALFLVFDCPACGMPCLVDASKHDCAGCGTTFPVLSVALPGGRRLPIDSGAVVVGRGVLGGSQKVSVRHAILRRVGPEVYVECVGRNPSFRRAGDTWMALPNGKPVLLKAGDELRLADQTVAICA